MQFGLEASARKLVVAVVLCSARGADAGDLFYGVEAGAFHDNNVSRAQRDGGVVRDSGLSADANVGAAYPLNDRDTLSLSATLRAAQFQRFHGLDVTALGAALAYRTKLGLGLYAPRAAVIGSLAVESYGDSARNGQRSRLALELGRRLSEQWDLSGGFALDRFDAGSVQPALQSLSRDVYSIRGRTLFARAEYALSERWLAFAGLSARRGDVVTSDRADPEILEYASATVAVPTFGPGYFAYRIPGITRGASFGASLATSPHSSLNFGFTRETTLSPGGLDYRSTLINASFIYFY